MAKGKPFGGKKAQPFKKKAGGAGAAPSSGGAKLTFPERMAVARAAKK